MIKEILSGYRVTIFTARVASFGCKMTADFLADLAMKQPSDVVIVTDRNDAHITITFSNTEGWRLNRLLSGVKQIFNPQYLTFETIEKPEFSNACELLNYLLKRTDWTYAVSDDPSVYSAGTAHFARMKRLINCVLDEEPATMAKAVKYAEDRKDTDAVKYLSQFTMPVTQAS